MNMKTMKFSKISLILFTVLAMGFTSARAQSSDFIEAMKMIQTGRNSQARSLLEKEIAANPDNDAAYYYLSTVLSFSRESELMEQYMKKALELSPENFWYKYNLAIFYANTERPELGTALLEELINTHPKKSSLYFDLTNLYVAQNDIDKAMKALDAIEAKKGKSEAVVLTKLELLAKMKPEANVDSAYAYLADYYKDCKTPRIATMLGDYYTRCYKDSLALNYYNDATTLDENYTPAYYGKAVIYQGLRQYDNYFESITKFMEDPGISPTAKAEYFGNLTESAQFTHTFAPELDELVNTIRDTHPGDSTANIMASAYYYKTGRPFFSAELLKQTCLLYPDSPTIAQQYLIFLYYQKAWSNLTEQATLMLQKFQGNVNMLQLRAIAFTQLDNLQAAIEDYQAIVAVNPKDTVVTTSIYCSIGDLYSKIGDCSKAYSYYEKSLKKNPNFCPTLNNYAYHLSLQGKKLKKAKEMSKKTIEAEPNNPTYLDTYAWILHIMGENLEAKAIFKHAMLYGGKEDVDILKHYAEVLQALGENDLANIYRNQAKALEQR